MSLLLGDNEDDEDAAPVVEAVLALDNVTVEVDQYAATTVVEDDDGAPVPETFDFIGSEGPTLSTTVESSESEEEELTIADAPKEYIEFDLGDVDPMQEVAEPVHTGKGSLYSPQVEIPKDQDLLGDVGPTVSDTPDLPDLPEDEPAAEANLAQAVATETPVLPELPGDATPEPTTPNLPELPGDATPEPTTPNLPDLPDDEPETQPPPASEPATEVEVTEASSDEPDNRIWPWPRAEAWTPTQVYQSVVAAMEHVKHGRMEEAASTLDGLGPHLEHNLDMLLHISVLMQHLGRHDHMKWTLDMAAYVYPNDPHVLQARSRLLA